MKKLIQSALILLIVAGSAFASERKDGDQTTLISQKDAVVSVTYQNTKSVALLIEILDEFGATIHKEKVKSKKGFMKSYDLNEFGSGKYTFKVDDGNGKMERVVDLKSAQQMALYQIYGSERVKFISKNANQTLTVKMFDRNGNLIQKDVIDSGENGISRVYDLSKRRKGDTTIEISTDRKIIKAAKF